MRKIGKDIDSKKLWEDLAKNYVNVLSSSYHRHRIEVIMNLIPKVLSTEGKRILDFGCGDAVLFPFFLKQGVDVLGVDISDNIIEMGKKRLREMNFPTDSLVVADVNHLKNLQSNSLDGILCFNTLAYLTLEEEKIFYKEAYRIIKPNGYLAVSHSNELFDLYTFNRYTVEFFKNNFVENDKINKLLTHSEEPSTYVAYNVRENPLAYKFKLLDYGFKEVKQLFSNMHYLPPLLDGLTNSDLKFSHIIQKEYPTTLNIPKKDKWKLMFNCSTYMSLSKKTLT